VQLAVELQLWGLLRVRAMKFVPLMGKASIVRMLREIHVQWRKDIVLVIPKVSDANTRGTR